jgi:hypothetical protein
MVGAQERRNLRRVKLQTPTLIDGVLCDATGRSSAAFYESGRLESCPLYQADTLVGHQLKAGTWVYFDANGRLSRAWLSSDTELQGQICRGTGQGGWSVDFYPSGKLELCYLAHPAVIDGVPCRKASFWGEITGGVQVTFYESGRLRSCRAARDFTLQGRKYSRGERVELTPDGQPHRLPRATAGGDAPVVQNRIVVLERSRSEG